MLATWFNTMGNTDMCVSPIGLGTVKFGRNKAVKYPAHFELPSLSELANLLALAKDLNINLLDTAPAYGTSEARLGTLLKGQRKDWIISTKVGEEFEQGHSHYDFSAHATEQSIYKSLKNLGTDYLDIVLVHSNGDDCAIIKMGILDQLSRMKQKGLIRAYGMSTKTVEGGKQCVKEADVVMVSYNPIDTEQCPVIEAAATQKKGVLIKKAFASGHLDSLSTQSSDPIQTAVNFIFEQPGITSLVVGTINPQHLIHNVQCVHSSVQST